MPLSAAMDVNVLNEVFGGTNWSPPANLFFGLSTTAPAKDGTSVTEPTGNAYARVSIANNTTNFPTAVTSSGQSTKQNGVVITFPQATGSWGTPGYWVVYDAATGGSFVAYGTITTPKPIGTGDTPSFSQNGVTITMQ